MPMIVVGADTVAGESILAELRQTEREIRVFVSDGSRAQQLKSLGYKVATGDVSDESHVEGAALRCFSAVLIAEAADDDRERSFAATPEQVLAGWARAVANAEVQRVIWITDGETPATSAPEVAQVKPGDPDLPAKVATLDDAPSLPI